MNRKRKPIRFLKAVIYRPSELPPLTCTGARAGFAPGRLVPWAS